MTDLRLPNINAPTTEGQLLQMKQYMFQLTKQLNYALKDVKAQETEYKQTSQGNEKNSSYNLTEAENAIETFSKVKNLIIKSADVVNAYYEVINKKLEGVYVAESDFGTYKEHTDSVLEATSKSLNQHYTSIKEIEDAVNNLNELRKDSCYIKTGWLDEDQTIAGVEIGKYSETKDGTDVGFARFTTDELAFYDGQGTSEENKLAWFSKYRSYFRNVKLIGNIELDNDYIIDTSDGVAFKWVGES